VGAVSSVAPGRPKRLTGPLWGQRAARARGPFHKSRRARPKRLTGPSGGSERSERGGRFHPALSG
jgi:hypothetical protein